MEDPEENAKVGYCNPPKSGQFRKGQSGNPRGRPKRIDDPFTTLEKVLARRVAIAGEDRKVSIREALSGAFATVRWPAASAPWRCSTSS